MKILLVHPDDSMEGEPCVIQTSESAPWDWIVDLGWSGRAAYSRYSEQLDVRILSIYDLLDHEQHRRRMRDLLAVGLDHLLDSDSVDWWEVFSVYPYQQLEQLFLLSVLAGQIPENAEIFATRTHVSLDALSSLLSRDGKNSRIAILSDANPRGLRTRSSRYWRAVRTLLPSQLAEIAFDKWDTGYRLRRHFSRRPRGSSSPLILLPSAYANVTRAQVAYARMLPHRRFLLVLTRRNGQIPNLPENVEVRSLASYAVRSSPATGKERARLLAAWQGLQNISFESNPVLALATKMGAFGAFADLLKSGLRVRDAWREVLARNPISSLLSADEYNPYTRLPILLANSRNVRTVFCDHGALNMSFGIRRPASDTYLVKGNMARDYSVNWCGLPAEKVVVGAPSPDQPSPSSSPRNGAARDWIVYYSEAYELSAGRTRTLYAELLPELCQLAACTNRKVVVKLHPFESLRMRKAVIDDVLTPEQRSLVEIREGAMTPDLLTRAWCSLTLESSVAVESTLHRVPCFLCSWFDASWYDYGKQFAKYSAGYPLDSPQRIRDIPRLLGEFHITESTRRGLLTPITPERLDSVLAGK